MVIQSKMFWDRLEICTALAGACCGAITAATPQGYKTWPAGAMAIFMLGVALAKLKSKEFEEKAQAEKLELETVSHRVQQETIDRLAKDKSDLARRLVGAIVRVLWRRYFGQVSIPDQFKSRVTLYKCESPSNSTGKHLVIYVREGRYSDSPRTWLVDDNKPENCRGVAGLIWWRANLETIIADRDWPENGDTTSQGAFVSTLNATVEETALLNVKSRAFVGLPIVVANRKWGVLLLDSCDPGHIRENRSSNDMLKRYAYMLGEVLMEAGS